MKKIFLCVLLFFTPAFGHNFLPTKFSQLAIWKVDAKKNFESSSVEISRFDEIVIYAKKTLSFPSNPNQPKKKVDIELLFSSDGENFGKVGLTFDQGQIRIPIQGTHVKIKVKNWQDLNKYSGTFILTGVNYVR